MPARQKEVQGTQNDSYPALSVNDLLVDQLTKEGEE